MVGRFWTLEAEDRMRANNWGGAKSDMIVTPNDCGGYAWLGLYYITHPQMYVYLYIYKMLIQTYRIVQKRGKDIMPVGP